MILRDAAKGETLDGLVNSRLVAVVSVPKTEKYEAIIQGITQSNCGEIIYVRQIGLDTEVEDESRVLVITQETWNKMKSENLWNKQ